MKSNLVLGSITILFSVFFLIMTFQIPDSRTTTIIGSSEWPMLILIFMLIMGVLQIIKTVLESKRSVANLDEGTEEEEVLQESQGRVNESLKGSHWYILIAMAVYVALLQFIGFLFATPLLFLFTAWLLGMRKKSHLVLTTVISTVIFVVIFIYVLGIPFPRGTGIFQTFSYWIY
ncbi:tripartite tricarboxylate transporter TctB family protein [Ornithinibacillus contaminans]|uniref:tripartite tricarboxylate transporter TctB family protein n=1 Tax=Ornithinibacillus contaminans TaxID=694055 RepID=UPI00069E261C|nr:tripartite tricarboxylate transporter TctB family protein [Ornithinibacillus contaminans]